MDQLREDFDKIHNQLKLISEILSLLVAQFLPRNAEIPTLDSVIASNTTLQPSSLSSSTSSSSPPTPYVASGRIQQPLLSPTPHASPTPPLSLGSKSTPSLPLRFLPSSVRLSPPPPPPPEPFSQTTASGSQLSPCENLLVWTDGGCTNNGSVGLAAAGIGVFFAENCADNVSQPFPLENPTNQRAELYAIQRALEIALAKRAMPEWRMLQKITVYTDSAYSINCLTVWITKWVKNGWISTDNQPVKNKDIIYPTYMLMQQIKALGLHVAIYKVAGHSGNFGNDQADHLAKMGAQTFRMNKRNRD